MLTLIISEEEFYDDEAGEFKYSGGTVLELEHSLLSLSKWEAKYEKPFLSSEGKTTEETHGYIEAMVISGNFSSDLLAQFSAEDFKKIKDYIDSTQSATTISHVMGGDPRGSTQVITAELIYYWMVACTIPFDAEKWHINRLFSLIQICGIKNSNESGVVNPDAAQQQRDLNEERKRRLNTTG